jgi:hypothetical protein
LALKRSSTRSTVAAPFTVVEIIWASTIWGLFSCFLIFPLLGMPRRMQWAAMTLLGAELFMLAMYSYGGHAVATIGRGAATLDVPLLSVALLALAMMRGVRVESRR